MNNTALATKPAHVMTTYTQQVRDHAAAMQRLQDQYFAALKRAEATYFEGVKKVTAAVAEMTGTDSKPATNGGEQAPDDPRQPS